MKTLNKIVASGSLIFLSMGLQADIVHLDDVIVDGSACIGFDCVNGESFGFDTIRVKENNLRIKFQDTSNSASFPTNDWQLTANDSSNGGANKFSIDDIDGGRTPFTVEAGAPSHSLYVDDGGRLGLGTSTPVTDIHTKSGNTPTLRLEQDGSSGFTPQTWDVAGNEAGFFVRDATNGSTLPFRILPGAPSSALVVAAGGNVGVGDLSPDAALNIERSDGSAQILVQETNGASEARDLLVLENNGNPEIRMTNTGNSNSWVMSAGLRYVVKNNAGAWVSRIESNGDMEISGSLTTTGGTCGGGGCDLLFHPDTKIESIEEHAESMWANSYLPAVGPTVENEPFNLSEKTGSMLNELEKAHVYIEQLHKRLVDQGKQLENSDFQTEQLLTGHRQLLEAYHDQQEQLSSQQVQLEKVDQLEQLVNQLLKTQEGRSLFTSLR
ncbi:MAG: hypothetical protein IMF09_12930 [Proteobacteria bacterium]|nr:hypothetical protein [Pseudomonadota bacterium]